VRLEGLGQLKKVIGEPWFPGLTLKTLLNWICIGINK
jgi:hypothetical protein